MRIPPGRSSSELAFTSYGNETTALLTDIAPDHNVGADSQWRGGKRYGLNP
jgi:hypothetical protein